MQKTCPPQFGCDSIRMRRKVFAEGLRRGPAAWGPPERERVTKRTHLKNIKIDKTKIKLDFVYSLNPPRIRGGFFE